MLRYILNSSRGVLIIEALVAGAVGAAVLTGYWGTLQGNVNSLVLSRIVAEEQSLKATLTSALGGDSCKANIISSDNKDKIAALTISGSPILSVASSATARFEQYLKVTAIEISPKSENEDSKVPASEGFRKFTVKYQAYYKHGESIGTERSKSCSVAYRLKASAPNPTVDKSDVQQCELLDCGDMPEALRSDTTPPPITPPSCNGLDQTSCGSEPQCEWEPVTNACEKKPQPQCGPPPAACSGYSVDTCCDGDTRCKFIGGSCQDDPDACKDSSLTSFTCSSQPNENCCDHNSASKCDWHTGRGCEDKCDLSRACSLHNEHCCGQDSSDCDWDASAGGGAGACENKCADANLACSLHNERCCKGAAATKCKWVGSTCQPKTCTEILDRAVCDNNLACEWETGDSKCYPRCDLSLDCSSLNSRCCAKKTECELAGNTCQKKCEALDCTDRDSRGEACCIKEKPPKCYWYPVKLKLDTSNGLNRQCHNIKLDTCEDSLSCQQRKKEDCCNKKASECTWKVDHYAPASCMKKCVSSLTCSERTSASSSKSCCKQKPDECQWVQQSKWYGTCESCTPSFPAQCNKRKGKACCNQNTKKCEWDASGGGGTGACKICDSTVPSVCGDRNTKACCDNSPSTCKWEGTEDAGICYACNLNKACSAHNKRCCENPNNSSKCEWDPVWTVGSKVGVCDNKCDFSNPLACSAHNARCCGIAGNCKWVGDSVTGTCEKRVCSELGNKLACDKDSACEWESWNGGAKQCYTKCNLTKDCKHQDDRCCAKKSQHCEYENNKCEPKCPPATAACSHQANNNLRCCKKRETKGAKDCAWDGVKSQCKKKCLSSLTCSGVEGTLNEQACCNNATDRKCQWKWSGSKNACLVCDSSTPASCLGRKSKACCDRNSPTCKWWTGSSICCDTTKSCASITNIACCDKSANNCLWEGGACRAPKNCPADATVRGNCSRVLPQTNHNQKATVTCKSGYSGTCEATCHDGTFKNFRNTCVENKCPAKTIDGCSLLKASYGATKTCSCSSTKNSYWSGSRTYKCNKSGTGIWEPHSGSCTYTPPPPSGCSTSTYNNCKRYAKSHGSTSGTCVNGTSGSCSYKCNNGSWSYQSNSCKTPSPSPPSPPTPRQPSPPSPPPPIPPITPRTTTVSYSSCSTSTSSNCTRSYASHGGSSGSCASGYSGSCSCKCSNGSWIQCSGSCTKKVVKPSGSCPSGWSCIKQGRGAYDYCSTWNTRSAINPDQNCRSCVQCGCFKSGTLVTMSDGSFKDIEQLQTGDFVIGQTGINKVLKLKIRNYKGEVYSINGSKHFVTGGHPFMTAEGWKAFNVELAKTLNPDLEFAGSLGFGDVLIKANGEEEILIQYYSKPEDTTVYNAEVDGDNTYYADAYLVHNKGCFKKDTLVVLANKESKVIQDFKVGDKVLGQTGINTVLKVHIRKYKGLIYSINGSKHFVTGGHPFMTEEGWKAFNVTTAKTLNPDLEFAGTLKEGDILVKANGETEVLQSYSSQPEETTVYNLRVDGDSTYYADGYLVHNK